jgi:predicted  nucleic acid-binding Zn-ribbon protein
VSLLSSFQGRKCFSNPAAPVTILLYNKTGYQYLSHFLPQHFLHLYMLTSPLRNNEFTTTTRGMTTISVMHSCNNFKPQGNQESHPPCCVQAAVQMNNQLHNIYRYLQTTHTQLEATQSHFQATQSQLQATQNESDNTQRQKLAVEQALERERKANELVNQRFMELQERYKSAEELQEDLRKYVDRSKTFANEVAMRAEGLVNDLRAKLAGGEVAELQNGQSICGMILESAKNALLVRAISSQNSEANPLEPLGYITDQNMDLQQQVETLSKQVKDGKNEIANLNEALKLTADDGPRKKSRRGKISGGNK